MKEILRTGIILFLICAVSAGLCGVVNSVTAPVIEENMRSDSFEAILAAVYLSYGMDEARRIVGEVILLDHAVE